LIFVLPRRRTQQAWQGPGELAIKAVSSLHQPGGASSSITEFAAGVQVRRVRCEASGVMVPKDKAIKRFIVRNIVDASAIRDIQDSSVFDGEQQWNSSNCNSPCRKLVCSRQLSA
jgi:hypothetical protein